MREFQQNFLNQITVTPYKTVLFGEAEKKNRLRKKRIWAKNHLGSTFFPPFCSWAVTICTFTQLNRQGAALQGLTPFPVPWRSSIALQWPEVSKLSCLLAKLSRPLVLSFLICEKRIILILTCSSIPRKGSPVLTPGHKNINSDIRRLSIDCCLYVFTACSLFQQQRKTNESITPSARIIPRMRHHWRAHNIANMSVSRNIGHKIDFMAHFASVACFSFAYFVKLKWNEDSFSEQQNLIPKLQVTFSKMLASIH